MTREQHQELKDYFNEKFDDLEKRILERAVVLASSPTKNGGAIGILETKMDQQTELIAGQTKILETFFAADGICFKERFKNARSRMQTKWQWGAISILALIGSGWLGYLTRIVIEHFENGG